MTSNIGSAADRLTPFSTGSKTGGSMFGWDDAATLGIGVAGGLLQGLGNRGVEQGKLDADAFNRQQSILFQRDAGKANIGLGMFGQIYGSTIAPDLEFGRQAQAKRMELGEFMPKQMGLGREQATWETAFKGSPLFQNTSRKERLGRLQETIAAARAQPTGMFGRIAQAPIESLMV